jgi:protein gp37
MSTATKIEWTRGDDGSAGATWNPVTGCDEVAEGCDHCYAKTFAERWRGVPGHPFEQGFDVRLWPDRLDKPLSWRKPRRVFVNSMSDLFHDAVPTEFIARVFATMALSSRHTYQLLTKRPARMRSVLSSEDFREAAAERASDLIGHTPPHFGHWRLDLGGQRLAGDSGLGGDWTVTPAKDGNLWSPPWPLPNVWLGVSVETQKWADIRIPKLTKTPAAVRFLSCEPLLGPVDLDGLVGIHWVIAGGESGAGARPMHPAWARSLRDQCQAAGVPFFFKQWGAWAPTEARGLVLSASNTREVLVGHPLDDLGHRQIMRRVGKGKAGRELDGRAWDEFPEPVTS